MFLHSILEDFEGEVFQDLDYDPIEYNSHLRAKREEKRQREEVNKWLNLAYFMLQSISLLIHCLLFNSFITVLSLSISLNLAPLYPFFTSQKKGPNRNCSRKLREVIRNFDYLVLLLCFHINNTENFFQNI